MTTFTDQIIFLQSGKQQLAHSADTIQVSSNLTISGKFTTSAGVNVKLSSKTANYTITATDYIISIGTLSAPITITLPASPSNGDLYSVCDSLGSAATNNITVSGNGHNIAGASTYIMAINFESITVCYDSTATVWVVI
jgi:hypothetical protein